MLLSKSAGQCAGTGSKANHGSLTAAEGFVSRNVVTKFWIAALVLLLSGVPSASGQNIFGSFTGVITDASGSVVPNAIIVVRNTGTAAAFNTTSDAEGTFWVRNLPVGVYDLT